MVNSQHIGMEKTARKTSTDPVQERLRQNKAAWNKEVSAFVNDVIHFKKMMNGWPSKFFKERARITEPVPADPATIIGSLAGDFQEITNRGNALIQEQLNYSQNRRKRQMKQLNLPMGQPPQTPAEPEAPKVDLTKQLSLPAVAFEETELVKLAFVLEEKYFLETQASNPFSRFITRLFNPKIGFGEAARMRRLRMTMLDNCVKSYKELKKMHREIVKSSKASVVSSHKMMTSVWNYWNAVNRLYSTFKIMKPHEIMDPGGSIDTPELKEERDREAREVGNEPTEATETSTPPGDTAALLRNVKSILADFKVNVGKFPGSSLQELAGVVDSINAAPKNNKLNVIQNSDIEGVYRKALLALNSELETSGKSFSEISAQASKPKAAPATPAPQPPVPVVAPPITSEAQLRRWLGKARHQIIPGATSGPRLEVYNFIAKIREDLNKVMDLLEDGFDEKALGTAIGQVNREMIVLRTMMRSLYYSEKPEEISSTFF